MLLWSQSIGSSYPLCPLCSHPTWLNGNHAARATSIAEKSVTGIVAAYVMLSSPKRRSFFGIEKIFRRFRVAPKSSNSSHQNQRLPTVSPLKFALACKDCSSILLPHASHYSAELINLLLRQEGISSLLPIEEWMAPSMSMVVDFVEPTIVGPNLEVTISFLDKNTNCLRSVDSNSKITSTHLRNSSYFLRNTVHRGLQVMETVSGLHILLKQVYHDLETIST